MPHRDYDASYGDLGRGGAVGAGRKLPAHSRVPSLTEPLRIAIKTIGSHRYEA